MYSNTTRTRRAGSFCSIASALTAFTSLAMGVGPHYEVIEIDGPQGAARSWAYDINNAGLVTGSFEVDAAQGERSGFLWREARLTELPPMDNQTHAWGFGLNDTDEWVVGQTFRNNYLGITTSVFTSSVDLAPDLFDFLAIAGALSSDINNNSTPRAVGWYYTGEIVVNYPVKHAFTVPIDGNLYEPTSLDTLGGLNSWAYAINDANEIVGASNTTAGPMHAFLWRNGRMTDLGTLGGELSEARDINNDGVIIGWARTASGATHAMISDGEQMRDIGTLGGNYSIANGINADNLVVGVSSTADGALHAFVYDAQTREMADLNDLVSQSGWVLEEAQAINDHGQIVGWGRNPDGVSRAFVMNPIESSLELSDPAPGIAGMVNTFSVTGATPFGDVYVVAGRTGGATNVRGCPGLTVEIRSPELVGQSEADGNGFASVERFVTGRASGKTLLFQAVDHTGCARSNLVRFEFE